MSNLPAPRKLRDKLFKRTANCDVGLDFSCSTCLDDYTHRLISKPEKTQCRPGESDIYRAVARNTRFSKGRSRAFGIRIFPEIFETQGNHPTATKLISAIPDLFSTFLLHFSTVVYTICHPDISIFEQISFLDLQIKTRPCFLSKCKWQPSDQKTDERSHFIPKRRPVTQSVPLKSCPNAIHTVFTPSTMGQNKPTAKPRIGTSNSLANYFGGTQCTKDLNSASVAF
jgi:hypothetical protein